MGGGACANPRSADAAIITGRRDAALFFMDSLIIYDPRPDEEQALPVGKG
jgi:hypothetical protein